MAYDRVTSTKTLYYNHVVQQPFGVKRMFFFECDHWLFSNSIGRVLLKLAVELMFYLEFTLIVVCFEGEKW